LSSQRTESFEELLRERVHGLTEGSRPAVRRSVPGEPVPTDLREARRFVDFAFQRKDITVQRGTRLTWLKRLVLKLGRPAVAPQTEFNAAVVEALEHLLRAVHELHEMDKRREMERRERAALTTALKREMQRVSELSEQMANYAAERFEEAQETVAELSAKVRRALDPPDLPPSAYPEFEDQSRGPEADIRERQSIYLPFFQELSAVLEARGPIADLGCGRGEFLEALRRVELPAVGVDLHPVMVERCRAKGLSVERGDLLSWLGSRQDSSLAGLFAAQVVEHLPLAAVLEVLRLAREKLARGGGLAFETVNPESLYAMKYFWQDPTHVRPIPANTLEMLARAAGFEKTEIRFLSPVPAEHRLKTGDDANLSRLDELIFGHQDYALFARIPL
jgi:SAM-dependent methyltransferase